MILIDDKVLPDGKPVEYTAGLNLAMLALFRGAERTEKQWRKLLGEGGYEIRAIKKFTDFGDSIIVAARRE